MNSQNEFAYFVHSMSRHFPSWHWQSNPSLISCDGCSNPASVDPCFLPLNYGEPLTDMEPNTSNHFLSGNETLLFSKKKTKKHFTQHLIKYFNTCATHCVMCFAQIPPQEHFPLQNTQKSPLGFFIFIKFDILDRRGTDKHISLTHLTECSS